LALVLAPRYCSPLPLGLSASLPAALISQAFMAITPSRLRVTRVLGRYDKFESEFISICENALDLFPASMTNATAERFVERMASVYLYPGVLVLDVHDRGLTAPFEFFLFESRHALASIFSFGFQAGKANEKRQRRVLYVTTRIENSGRVSIG
jgi:hypothetical protein